MADGKIHRRKIKTRHLLMAIGAGLGLPNPTKLPGCETFKGTLMHQDGFRNAKQFAGQRAIIVGAATTAHDIAQDCFDNNMQVTMVQRSETVVAPKEFQNQHLIWSRDIPTTLADRIGSSGPLKVALEIIRRNDMESARQPQWVEYFAGLEKAGLKLNRKYSSVDLIVMRYSGFYIDVGTSKHIINGDIRVKSGVPIKSLTKSGMLFEDGEELSADLIVTATGYEPDYRKAIAPIVGDEIAEELPEFWGLTKNGDVIGMMEEARPGLWMSGGSSPQARWTSRFVALMMMLDLAGVDNVIH